MHKFQLVSQVSAKWKDFGLLLNVTLNDLEALEQEHRGNAKNIWNRVMDHWLAGKGGYDYPASWEGLYTLLKDLDFSEVSDELEKAVSGHCSS